MNTILRVFFLGLVVVSAAAAASAPSMASHQTASASLPIPTCGWAGLCK